MEVVLVKRGPVIELKTGLLVVPGMPLELVAGVLPVMVSELLTPWTLLDVLLEKLLAALLEALEVPAELDVAVELEMPMVSTLLEVLIDVAWVEFEDVEMLVVEDVDDVVNVLANPVLVESELTIVVLVKLTDVDDEISDVEDVVAEVIVLLLVEDTVVLEGTVELVDVGYEELDELDEVVDMTELVEVVDGVYVDMEEGP
ncbi:hypothetical protein CGLO_06493 [Colletotrichum gloeosporioides Cg-14]|uniref:Uncharacterized protein n=1 Tax=Colletotrichum gloeosporioides (strain Cg-14) TaxID=1237896 RepID=T0LZ18_COLGC|nr:hypothetical protein CGLO_06493 [Colletotrichum gloeosporioides Cg-14]